MIISLHVNHGLIIQSAKIGTLTTRYQAKSARRELLSAKNASEISNRFERINHENVGDLPQRYAANFKFQSHARLAHSGIQSDLNAFSVNSIFASNVPANYEFLEKFALTLPWRLFSPDLFVREDFNYRMSSNWSVNLPIHNAWIAYPERLRFRRLRHFARNPPGQIVMPFQSNSQQVMVNQLIWSRPGKACCGCRVCVYQTTSRGNESSKQRSMSPVKNNAISGALSADYYSPAVIMFTPPQKHCAEFLLN